MYEKLIIITTLQQLPLRVSKVQWLHFIGAVEKSHNCLRQIFS